MRFPKFLAILVFSFSARSQFDMVLHGGHVIDPKNGIDQQMDVAISGGKIAAVASGIDAGKAKKVIDVRGLYVTPGLVDIHVHLFHATNFPAAWSGDDSLQPDAFSFRT